MEENKIEKIMDKVLERAVKYQVLDLVEECFWELDRMGKKMRGRGEMEREEKTEG